MLFGMGSLSLGELAGERMKVSLEANSPEDEQDCFSDNTHNSHFYDAKAFVTSTWASTPAPTAPR
jgi:putative iron-regulated protein